MSVMLQSAGGETKATGPVIHALALQLPSEIPLFPEVSHSHLPMCLRTSCMSLHRLGWEHHANNLLSNGLGKQKFFTLHLQYFCKS